MQSSSWMTEGGNEPTGVEMCPTPHQRAEGGEVSCVRAETPSRRWRSLLRESWNAVQKVEKSGRLLFRHLGRPWGGGLRTNSSFWLLSCRGQASLFFWDQPVMIMSSFCCIEDQSCHHQNKRNESLIMCFYIYLSVYSLLTLYFPPLFLFIYSFPHVLIHLFSTFVLFFALFPSGEWE